MKLESFSTYGFELSPQEIGLFEKYLSLFTEYNAHTNLSAIRDEQGIVEKHFVDSLFGVSPIVDACGGEIKGRQLLDI
jgi:16S rRNA G527 N7-methylase RsmG